MYLLGKHSTTIPMSLLLLLRQGFTELSRVSRNSFCRLERLWTCSLPEMFLSSLVGLQFCITRVGDHLCSKSMSVKSLGNPFQGLQWRGSKGRWPNLPCRTFGLELLWIMSFSSVGVREAMCWKGEYFAKHSSQSHHLFCTKSLYQSIRTSSPKPLNVYQGKIIWE